ncbi:MAG: molybdenum cofactor biosynthesis protein MoaE [Perlucidibaca sp.]
MSFHHAVQTGPLSPHSDSVADWSRLPGVGATVTFTGQVRVSEAGGAPVEALELEHYPGMSERMLQALLAEAAVRWSLLAGEIVHRVGRIEAGETIVRVSVASAHRRAAFEAAEWLMDALKSRAPFWKREWVGGQPAWVDEKASDAEALARWPDRDVPGGPG